MAERYRTGESVPEDGTYKVEKLVFAPVDNDHTEIELKKGEKFPSGPLSKDVAYWVKK
ncbi:YjzC family protein [Halobacillus massiliensis]|uniref:YjzC family protein n=1 Tax=Halobacillus massiliensis TaxID=1926286 RepID=UPI0009E3950A|nr:YjzC family protein [Halobacillus massiliensis]